MPKAPAPKPVEELTFEVAFEELQQVVSTLEAEPASLDQAMALFERGQALAKRCTQLLDEAELKVKRLAGGQLADLEIEE